jgi:hypothetical protein
VAVSRVPSRLGLGAHSPWRHPAWRFLMDGGRRGFMCYPFLLGMICVVEDAMVRCLGAL